MVLSGIPGKQKGWVESTDKMNLLTGSARGTQKRLV